MTSLAVVICLLFLALVLVTEIRNMQLRRELKKERLAVRMLGEMIVKIAEEQGYRIDEPDREDREVAGAPAPDNW